MFTKRRLPSRAEKILLYCYLLRGGGVPPERAPSNTNRCKTVKKTITTLDNGIHCTVLHSESQNSKYDFIKQFLKQKYNKIKKNCL